ncbi:hypothetical protein QP166_07430 [Sphingomonas sp. LR60]|uniref:hypothetical protein n=1 Tax=Sphingomonas sp. LR60 TaxID=3050233 RepID=UPI002FE1DB6B
MQDITGTSSLEVPSSAYDLQIDLKPTSAATRWKPALSQLQYQQYPWPDDTLRAVGYSCPKEVNPLRQYTSDYNATSKSSPSLDSYVNAFVPTGQTYHDIGLIWGARLLAPDGIYSATNADAVAPGGYQVSRHIVFMTDGQLDTDGKLADAWGVNAIMNRVQADNAVAPPSASEARIYASHLRRTQIICNEMKKRGFIIWIVGFGNQGLSQELKECATDPDHWSIATDTAALRQSFAKIAQTIGGLRLSS